MAMRAVLTGAGLVGAGVTLCGCSSAPSPAPMPVQVAWDNHFDAFGKGAAAGGVNDTVARSAALDQIMLDYDDESMIATFNDECAGTRAGYKQYSTPQEIRGYFDGLFQQIVTNANLDSVGPSGDAPVVFEGDKASANVFLTWRTVNLPANVITYATDTFTFQEKGGKAMIWKQNIVTTEPSGTCEVVGTQRVCADDANPVCLGWENHFKYFGEGANAATDNAINDTKMTAALDGIMADYTDASIIQVFDNRDKSYNSFRNLVDIRGMFQSLFTDILAAATPANDPANIGLAVPGLEVEENFNGVFLVWKSNSHPKATDTFVFNDAGKIIRQNIVVSTKVPGEVKVQV